MPLKNPPPCAIDGCEKPQRARGWCSMHWYRWRHNGDPNSVHVRTRSEVPCAADGCSRMVWAQGLCGTHLSRLKRQGHTGEPVRATTDERFWIKVNKDGPAPDFRPDLGPCWLWTGSSNKEGHGHFFPTRRALEGAHRYSYRTLVGPIPDGLHLDHLCRVPRCVNPDHLEPVTVAENTRRGYTARKESA